MKQEVIIAPGSINQLIDIVNCHRPSNIFWVTGKHSFKKSGAKKALSKVFEHYNSVEFSNFSPNPKQEEVQQGYELFKHNNIQLMIAVGGGSVIDMAKLIKNEWMSHELNVHETHLPLIAIPTTAGSGTEATHFAVCYKDGKKDSIASEFLLPQIVIIDPHLLSSQTKYQMAVSGIDAFCQAVESYWNINANDTSLDFATKAIKLVWKNLPLALGGDETALENLALGSFYAGKAINITKTTAPHAYSYYYTYHFGIPHGHAVALFFPFFVNYHAKHFQQKCIHPGGREYFEKLMVELSTSLDTDLDHIGHVIVSFFQDCGLESDFEKLNISEQDFLLGLKSVNTERLQNNPLFVAEEKLHEIYRYNKNHRIKNPNENL